MSEFYKLKSKFQAGGWRTWRVSGSSWTSFPKRYARFPYWSASYSPPPYTVSGIGLVLFGLRWKADLVFLLLGRYTWWARVNSLLPCLTIAKTSRIFHF